MPGMYGAADGASAFLFSTTGKNVRLASPNYGQIFETVL